MKTKFNKNIKFIVFFIFSVVALLTLNKLNLLNFEILFKSIKKHPDLIFLSGVIYAISILLGSLRYKIILKGFNYKLKLKYSLKITASSIFYGQWFPGSSALIELFRIFFLKQHIDIKLKEAFLSAIYDKAIGLVSFIILCLFCVLIKYDLLEQSNYYFLALILIFSLFIINKTPAIILKIFNINYKSQNYFLISTEMIISLLISGLIVISYFLISKTTNANLNFIDIAIMMPFIAIIGILPIGLGNLGGLQIGTLLIFQFVSENNSEIVSMSVIFALITILINSSFGLIFLKSTLNIFKKALIKYEKKI